MTAAKKWRPARAEQELLTDMLTARLAPAKIAETLYAGLVDALAFLRRLSRHATSWRGRRRVSKR
jgi:hypothetical protein